MKAAALLPKPVPPDPLSDDREALAGVTATPEVRLWLRIGAVQSLLDGHLRARLRREHGITPARYHAMALLDKGREGMTMGELSKRLMVSNGAITGLVDRLVRDGKVTRTPLPGDRRTHIIRLTPAGREEVQAMERLHADWLADVMGSLGREEMTALLGLQYVTAVGVVIFGFFLMVLFHVSLALSNLQEDETATAQRCALLETKLERLAAELAALRRGPDARPEPVPAPALDAPPAPPAAGGRVLRGFVVGVPLLIVGAALAVLWSGLQAPQALVGDEVTHYHMLVHQADRLPAATFEAPIPTGWGDVELRRYPHANLWHYAGAWLYRGLPAFATVQVFQALFLVQLLAAGFFLVRRRPDASTPAILLYLLVLASLPVTLMFSMTFYQDVPMTAQAVTAFCLLDRRRWVWATAFLVAALGMKETAVLFIPACLIMLFVQRLAGAPDRRRSLRVARALLPAAIACALLWVPMKATDRMLATLGGYYPFQQVKSIVEKTVETVAPRAPAANRDSVSKAKSRPVSRYEAEIIANHPGDLRLPANWVVYGGVVLWLVVGLGLARRALDRRQPVPWRTWAADRWPLWVGLSFLLPSAYLLKTAPDARFFLPALPFMLLPFSESCARLPRPRLWMPSGT